MTVSVHQKIQIKGIQDGILVSLSEGAWEELQADLLQRIAEQSSFFQGAHLALDVGNRVLHAAELGALRDQLSDRGISLRAILSNSPTTEQTARVLGLATRLHTPKPERTIRALDTNLSGETSILVQRTLRSGYKMTVKRARHSHWRRQSRSGNYLIWKCGDLGQVEGRRSRRIGRGRPGGGMRA